MKRSSTERPASSHMDKLCALALAGVLVTTALVNETIDGMIVRAATQADKPVAVTETALAIDFTPLLEAAEAAERAGTAPERTDVPLPPELQAVLQESCAAHGVPLCLALGLMEVESGFQPDANSGVSRGLMQLNERYFPADLSPAENIQAGVAYLGELLERYSGDTQAALTAYNAGHDTGDRVYARAVLDAAEKWGNG